MPTAGLAPCVAMTARPAAPAPLCASAHRFPSADGRAADLAARKVDDGGLSQQALSQQAGRSSNVSGAGESLDSGQCVNG